MPSFERQLHWLKSHSFVQWEPSVPSCWGFWKGVGVVSSFFPSHLWLLVLAFCRLSSAAGTSVLLSLNATSPDMELSSLFLLCKMG